MVFGGVEPPLHLPSFPLGFRDLCAVLGGAAVKASEELRQRLRACVAEKKVLQREQALLALRVVRGVRGVRGWGGAWTLRGYFAAWNPTNHYPKRRRLQHRP